MKKTKLKRGKGGLMAFFAAVVLMVNVAPAVAGGTDWSGIPNWLMLALTIYDKLVSEGEGGGGGIPCWSRARNTQEYFYVDCASCTRVYGQAMGLDSKCTPK